MARPEKETIGEVCPRCGLGSLVPEKDPNSMVCTACGAHFRKDQLIRTDPEHRNQNIPSIQIYRLKRWQQRIRVTNATEKNLAFALSELDRVSTASGVPKQVRESAYGVYRRAVNRNLVKGRSIETLAAASVYAACRICEMPRTMDEIAEASGTGKKELARTYRFLKRGLGLDSKPAKPEDYVQRYCLDMGLSENVWNMALDILQEATEKGLTSGLGPAGIASAAVYVASYRCGEPRSQSTVSKATGVSEVTLRARYKKLSERLGLKATEGDQDGK